MTHYSSVFFYIYNVTGKIVKSWGKRHLDKSGHRLAKPLDLKQQKG